MQVLIIVIAVLVILFLMGKFVEPDVEKFDLNQIRRHVKNLQRWIDANSFKMNMSESEKTELAKKKAQLDHAMAVWKRKDEEVWARMSLIKNKDSLSDINQEITPITDKVNQLTKEGISEAEAIAVALKEWEKSNKSQ